MKKMRRLIPAIAMLLVSAVMLSTASFAWFTMNEKVTVNGVQIQAKADGSLLISDAPFSELNLGSSETLVTAGIKNLKPMTYGTTAAAADAIKGAQLVEQTTAGWYKPVDNKTNNIVTGLAGAMGLVVDDEAADIAEYNYKEEFYIATAGEAIQGANLTIKLSAPTAPDSGKTHLAYAAAVYVVAKTDATKDTTWKDDNDIVFVPDATNTEAATPNAIIFVDSASSRNTVTLTNVTVPSIAGAVDGNEVGLKVIVHFYVDGALKALKQDGTNAVDKLTVNSGSTYVQYTGAWSETTPYFTVAATQKTLSTGADVTGLYTYDEDSKTYTPASGTAETNVEYYDLVVKTAIANDTIKNDGITADDNWFTATPNPVQTEYTYVRSADIPSSGATLRLEFSAVKAAN